jgi:glycine dehydrogenase subunit 1
MAVRAHRKSKSARILVPAALNPTYLQVARAITGGQNLTFDVLPYEPKLGTTQASGLDQYKGQDITAVVVQQPNFFGQLEDVDAITDWAHANSSLAIAVVNPLSLAILKPPGEWGAKGVDIVVGDGQPLGVPLSSGGPYFGFMTARMEHVRQMPGRIIGRTVDLDGKQGFTLTLQAREQHIRRSKATSNICTNQGLLVTAATIHMSLLGAAGLEQVAATCQRQTRSLVEALMQVKGVRAAFSGPRFHEAVLQLDRNVDEVLEKLARVGITGGFDLTRFYPDLGNALLVCATETRTDEDIDQYARALAEVMK